MKRFKINHSAKLLILALTAIVLAACTCIYKNDLNDILGISDVQILSSDRYESQSIGEWYILEKYTLSPENIQNFISQITFAQKLSKKGSSYMLDGYFLGWYPLSCKTPYYNLILESSHFLSNKDIVREYETYCHKNIGFYAIMVNDTNNLDNEFKEKTIIVVDTCMHNIFLCNYHY